VIVVSNEVSTIML